AGVDRMLLASEQAAAPPEAVDVFVAVADAAGTGAAFALAQDARRAGLSAQLELAGRSLKGQLRHADRIGARYVAIVGEDSHASLRDMSSGEQREVPRDAVIAAIKEAHP
ncbi:MAG: histidine--tRNA ligase, partial [Solirubrobacterales bacterium]|nr:histidine--tRNA ligase [Solirubrobacterales bacterium]